MPGKGKILIIFFMLSMLSVGCRKSNVVASEISDNVESAMAVAGPEFNADSAYSNIERQVSFGPRVPGTAAHKATGEWLIKELKRRGATVSEQRAELTAYNGDKLPMLNILARYNPEKGDRLMLVAHWDTRPWADKDPNPANHNKPIDGANDGGSGVGVLLETARILAEKDPGVGVDILLVDCEDYGRNDDDDSWCMGSEYYANSIAATKHNISRVILLDMVGGYNAKFLREEISENEAPDLNAAFWAMGEASGYGDCFINQLAPGITDDHLPFLKIGIPAIDIIENGNTMVFNDNHHTLNDNLQNIDKKTLKAVGQTLVNYIYSK